MGWHLLNFPEDIRRAIETHAAQRRHDYLRVLQLSRTPWSAANSASIYAWYRLGCHQKVVDLAKDYYPRCARDIVAISVSLAATGFFQKCEDIVVANLTMLRRQVRYAIEAAKGILKFIPSLAIRICQGIPVASDLRSAAHIALGQLELARDAIQEGHPPRRSDLLAGHFFLKANLATTVVEKLENVNRQLSEFGLSGIHFPHDRSSFCLDLFRNEPGGFLHNGPLVSIIVPAFNAEAHLQMSVTSLLQQSYQNLEVIIVNDGSVDGTGRIAKELSTRDARVRVLDFQQNRGAYAARNAALREASGKFVSVNDADDFAHREKIERQVQPLLRDEDVVFSISDLVRVSADGMLARWGVYPLQRLNTSSLTFRRDAVLRDCGYWEEHRYGADSEYFFRLRNSYPKERWVRIRQPLTFAADRPGSLTASVSTGGLGVPSDPRRTGYTEAYTLRWLERSMCTTGN